MFRPQRPQNRAFWANGFAQRGQGYVATAVSPRLTITNLPPPHLPQNLTPSANREPQFPHATIPGIMLDWGELLLTPCEEEG